MIKLDTTDVDFLSMVIEKGNPQQARAATQRLEDLTRLDAMTGGEGHIYLDSKDDDPVEAARKEMVERHRSAWKSGTRMDATYVQGSAAEQPKTQRMMEYEAEEDEAERARLAMIKRNREAWKKSPWQPTQD